MVSNAESGYQLDAQLHQIFYVMALMEKGETLTTRRLNVDRTQMRLRTLCP